MITSKDTKDLNDLSITRIFTRPNGQRALAFVDETILEANLRYDRTDALLADLFEETQVEETQVEETVWVPVGKSDEVELAWGTIWTIHGLFTSYKGLRRAGEQFAAMRVLTELKDKGFGLAHSEYRDITNWLDDQRFNQK